MMNLTKPMKQNCNKKVDNNKDVGVSIVKNSKTTIITTSVIPMGRKLLTILTKIILPQNK